MLLKKRMFIFIWVCQYNRQKSKEGDLVKADIVGILIVFAAGIVIATINYYISKYVIKNQPEKYAIITVFRQLIQVFFLVAVFFISKYLPWDRIYLLIAGAVGTTLPMIWFTHRLVKVSQSVAKKTKKGDNKDG